MPLTETPLWVWVFIAVAMVPALLGVAATMLWESRRARAAGGLRRGDLQVELWGGDWYRVPRADAIVVPVSTDMQMYTPVAKWVRDASAYEVQNQANRVAPMDPGQAFMGTGGKYRFKMAAVAVVMDDQKRVTGDWITGAVERAIRLAGEHGAQTVVVPDMTEDLIRHPQTISADQRRQTAEVVAPAVLRGILNAGDVVDEVKLWVWKPENRALYAAEMERAEGASGHARITPTTA